MQERLFRASRIAGSALLISILPAAVAGQARPIVSNQLALSQSEAALHLEFAGNGTLEITLRDGSVMIDGEETTAYCLGGAGTHNNNIWSEEQASEPQFDPRAEQRSKGFPGPSTPIPVSPPQMSTPCSHGSA